MFYALFGYGAPPVVKRLGEIVEDHAGSLVALLLTWESIFLRTPRRGQRYRRLLPNTTKRGRSADSTRADGRSPRGRGQ